MRFGTSGVPDYKRNFACLMLVYLAWIPLTARAAEPRVLVVGCQLHQIAHEPEIVTPIGVAFDQRGRLLVVESHTHQRPENYKGPSGDRLRMLSDSDGDGTLDSWSTFAEGFRHAMNVAVRGDGGVYLVTRSHVLLLRDLDNDGSAEVNQELIHLQTEIDYPHNALSGIYVDGETLYLGVGENFGGDYELVGSDGRKIPNHGGIGTVYSCKTDGSQLERLAEGFWNPFSLCLAEGELFTVDNDPDASPPCRLIHAIATGDYGFRFEYGRAGVHPLHSWNGEYPGTLPMICGTGEAPTAIVFHRGYLWVTSWGDHRIERYQLTPDSKGRYTAKRTVVVQGDDDFRPTGMAVGPDGSLYFSDWVNRSYPVHGQGRLWRLELADEMRTDFLPADDVQVPAVRPNLADLHALRWEGSTPPAALEELLSNSLKSTDPDVRLYAVRWIAEARIVDLVEQVEALLAAIPPSEQYYLAALGAVDWLRGDNTQRASGITDGLLMRELRNSQRSPETKALALSLISPDYLDLTLEHLGEFLKSENESLRVEAVRTLALRTDAERLPTLATIADDASQPSQARVEALVGLAAEVPQYQALFDKFTSGPDPLLQQEALRNLRLSGLAEAPAEEKPAAEDLESWSRLLAVEGDAESGRRLFFSPVGPRCGVCHRYHGRGGNVGPDLTRIARQNSRERVIASILAPSREVAPEFEPWVLRTVEGQTFVGLRMAKGGDDGVEPYVDPTGKPFVLPSESVAYREPSSTSIMPAGLEKNLSIQDLRDLVSLLMQDD